MEVRCKNTAIPIFSWKCYKCQGYGHVASECPHGRVVTIMEDVIKEDEEEVNQEEGKIEEITMKMKEKLW